MIVSMCLSLMAHALEAVDLLDLAEQVFGQLLLAQDPEDVVGVDRAVHEGRAGLDPLARRRR